MSQATRSDEVRGFKYDCIHDCGMRPHRDINIYDIFMIYSIIILF